MLLLISACDEASTAIVAFSWLKEALIRSCCGHLQQTATPTQPQSDLRCFQVRYEQPLSGYWTHNHLSSNVKHVRLAHLLLHTRARNVACSPQPISQS